MKKRSRNKPIDAWAQIEAELRRRVYKDAADFLRNSKARVPVDTGHLRSSVHYRVVPDRGDPPRHHDLYEVRDGVHYHVGVDWAAGEAPADRRQLSEAPPWVTDPPPRKSVLSARYRAALRSHLEFLRGCPVAVNSDRMPSQGGKVKIAGDLVLCSDGDRRPRTVAKVWEEECTSRR